MATRQISAEKQRQYLSKFDIAAQVDMHPDTVAMWLCRGEFTHIVRRKVNSTVQYYINQAEVDRIRSLRRIAKKGEGKKNVKSKQK